MGLKTFFSLSELILEKTLRISLNQDHKFSLGDVINFGTVDAKKFGGISWSLVYMISIPISSVIGITYLYYLMGISIVPAFAAVFVLMYINYRYVKKGIVYQKEYMKVRGQRLKKTDEVFNNIRFIKSSGLEMFFCNKLDETRKEELNWLKYMSYRMTYTIWNSWLSSSVLTVVLLFCYIWLGNTLTVAKIFTAMSILRTFQDSLAYLPNVIGTFFDFIVSSERLTEYLTAEEKKTAENSYKPGDAYDIVLKGANFYWKDPPPKEVPKGTDDSKIDASQKSDLNEPLITDDNEQSEAQKSQKRAIFELMNFNLEIGKGELVAIIGKSGAGKTSFILSLLSELSFHENENFVFSVNPSISLVLQKPWIRNDTMRENILFGLDFDEDRYQRVLRLSCLDEDLHHFAQGDQTIIGDKGVNVSGGQRARIAIARALYQDKNLIIMDDPLSALDVNVGDTIFRQTILQQLHGKTRLIAIHNISYLKYFDKILFLDKGTIRYFGGYNDLVKLQEFAELVRILQETSLFQSKDQLEAEAKHHDILEPDKQEVESVDDDPQLHETKITDETRITESQEDKLLKTKTEISKTTTQMNIDEELKEKGEVNLKLFFKYLRLGRAIFLLFPMLGASMYIVFSAYRYFFYNEQGDLPPEQFNRSYFMKVTIILEIGFVTFGTLRGFFCLMFGLDVSRKLNSLIIFRMMHASVIKFFNKNPVGKILNRLSDDIETIDRSIPISTSYFFNVTSNILLNMILLLMLSSPFLIVFLVIYFVIIFRMQRVFTKSYKEVTRLNSTSKSPVFHLFSDSVNGLVDIRTNQKQNFIVESMGKHVDFHFRTGVVLSAYGEWFRLRVTLYSMMFIIPSYVFLLLFKENFLDYSSILVSVLTSNMEMFIYFMQVLSTLEKNFVSFDRCDFYMNLEMEAGLKKVPHYFKEIRDGFPISKVKAEEEEQLKKTLNEWPKHGQIVFSHVNVSYSYDNHYVLKDLFFEIKQGEKIGVIGRTGAGKSSLVTSIIRFFDSIEGKIEIDHFDIYKLDVKQLRRSLTYISQDSYFFEGSLRENLDPFNVASDEKIIELLKESEIYDKVALAGGLEWQLSSGGGNLSVGEKQILCFIRAIINLRKVIILDEATSNLDLKSENLLEKMKDKYFANSTTITIAHRLNTVYQSDRILVLEQGRIKTFSNVKDLSGSDLEFFNSYIKQMIV